MTHELFPPQNALVQQSGKEKHFVGMEVIITMLGGKLNAIMDSLSMHLMDY